MKIDTFLLEGLAASPDQARRGALEELPEQLVRRLHGRAEGVGSHPDPSDLEPDRSPDSVTTVEVGEAMGGGRR